MTETPITGTFAVTLDLKRLRIGFMDGWLRKGYYLSSITCIAGPEFRTWRRHAGGEYTKMAFKLEGKKEYGGCL